MEFENVGWLKGKPGQLKNAYGQRHKGPATQAPDGTWWEAFTDAQLKSAERVMRFFGQAAPHLRDQKPGRVIRHTQARPPWASSRQRITSSWLAASCSPWRYLGALHTAGW